MPENDEATTRSSLRSPATVLSYDALDGLSGSSLWLSHGVFPGWRVCSPSAFPLGDPTTPPQGFNDHIYTNYIYIHISVSDMCSEIWKHPSSHFLDISLGMSCTCLTFTESRLAIFSHHTCSTLCVLCPS